MKFCENSKQNPGGGGVGFRGSGWISEVFVKIPKKSGGGGRAWGVRVDVYIEMKFL